MRSYSGNLDHVMQRAIHRIGLGNSFQFLLCNNTIMDVEAGFTEFKSLHHYVFSVFNLGANCVDFNGFVIQALSTLRRRNFKATFSI